MPFRFYTQPIWFYYAAKLAQKNDRSKMVAIVAKLIAGGISEGGVGAERLRDCDGWHSKQFLFFLFFIVPSRHTSWPFSIYQYGCGIRGRIRRRAGVIGVALRPPATTTLASAVNVN